MEGRTIKIASRESPLAMVQAEYIQNLIGGQIVGIKSEGDINLTSSLYSMPGIGVFVKQLEIELLENRADLAAHCLKDMPTNTTEGLTIAAILSFNTPRGDLAIFKQGITDLKDLPNGSKIGTSSLRRISTITHHYRYKEFVYENIRGNLNTRINKLQTGQYDCIILAAAGVHRLGWENSLSFQYLDEEEFLYAPGQAALALECRNTDTELIKYLNQFENREAKLRCEAERTFMKELEGVFYN